MRDWLAILVCHVLRMLLRMLGRNGGTTPGEMALKISPNILKRLRYPKIYIVVTGTNGKTSVTGMIRTAFEKAGYDVVSNRFGDNLIFGAASALLSRSGFSKKVKGDAVVLELDEMTFGRKIAHFKPTDVVITNFFRDQLDRCGEMATVVDTVRSALEDFQGRVFLSADDPGLWDFEGVSYTLAENEFSVQNAGYTEAAEGRFCPKCMERLHYNYYQYSHIGDFHCPSCGFGRRSADISAQIDEDRNLIVDGEDYGHREAGLYHYYNEIAVIAVAKSYGIERDFILDALNSYRRGIGRMERIGRVLLNLVKNPTGLNQVLRHLKRMNTGNEDTGALLFVLCDDRVDGHDVSWIWDADLRGIGIKKMICSGSRAYDMALRLKYEDGGFDIEVLPEIDAAVTRLWEIGGGYALSTYSALTVVRKEILKLAQGDAPGSASAESGDFWKNMRNDKRKESCETEKCKEGKR